jgi:hypothetical protein
MKISLFALLLLTTSLIHAKVENCEVNAEGLQALLQNNEVKLVFRKPIIVEPRIQGDFLSPTNHDQFIYMKEAAAKKRKIKNLVVGSFDFSNEGKIISIKGDDKSDVAFVNMNMSVEALKNSLEFTLVCKPKGLKKMLKDLNKPANCQ